MKMWAADRAVATRHLAHMPFRAQTCRSIPAAVRTTVIIGLTGTRIFFLELTSMSTSETLALDEGLPHLIWDKKSLQIGSGLLIVIVQAKTIRVTLP